MFGDADFYRFGFGLERLATQSGQRVHQRRRAGCALVLSPKVARQFGAKRVGRAAEQVGNVRPVDFDRKCFIAVGAPDAVFLQGERNQAVGVFCFGLAFRAAVTAVAVEPRAAGTQSDVHKFQRGRDGVQVIHL